MQYPFVEEDTRLPGTYADAYHRLSVLVGTTDFWRIRACVMAGMYPVGIYHGDADPSTILLAQQEARRIQEARQCSK